MLRRYALPVIAACAFAAFHGYYGLDMYPTQLTGWWCAVIFVVALWGLLSDPEWAGQACTMMGLLGTVTGFILALTGGGVEQLETDALGLALVTTAAGIGSALLLHVQEKLR